MAQEAEKRLGKMEDRVKELQSMLQKAAESTKSTMELVKKRRRSEDDNTVVVSAMADDQTIDNTKGKLFPMIKDTADASYTRKLEDQVKELQIKLQAREVEISELKLWKNLVNHSNTGMMHKTQTRVMFEQLRNRTRATQMFQEPYNVVPFNDLKEQICLLGTSLGKELKGTAETSDKKLTEMEKRLTSLMCRAIYGEHVDSQPGAPEIPLDILKLELHTYMELEGIFPDQQALLFAGEELEDGRLLKVSTALDESGLHLNFKLYNPIMVEVKTRYGGTCKIDVKSTNTIYQLKERIEKELRTPVHMQRLLHVGKQLYDATTIADNNMQNGAEVHLVHSLGYPSIPAPSLFVYHDASQM